MSATEPSVSSEVVPLIDLGRWRTGDADDRAAIAERVDVALREVGFLIITGHGIDDATIGRVRQTCAEVFALPFEAKTPYRQQDGIGGPGWIPIGAEANAYSADQATAPDLKESWTVSPIEPGATVATSRGMVDVANRFPTEVPEFESAVGGYIRAGLDLTAELFELLAIAIGAPPETFLELCRRPQYNLNLTWYPPVAAEGEEYEPRPDQFRIGPHADFGTITLLEREPSDPPLQIQLADGTWVDLPHVPDSIIVNVGDQLAYWSGGRWRSNPHRIPAPTGDAARIGRLSLVLFLETDIGAMLQPLGRPDAQPMDADAFLIGQLAAIDTALDDTEESR